MWYNLAMDTNVPMAAEQPVSSAPQGLKPAKELLREAWQSYKNKFWSLLGIMAIPYLAAFVLAGIFGAGISAAIALPLVWKVVAAVIVLAAALAFIYVQVWGQASLITFAAEEASSLKESFLKSRPLIMALFVTNLLVGLSILFGVVLFVVPGIIFALWFMFTSFIVVLEKASGFNAAMKSREYFRGLGSDIVLRLLLLLLVYIFFTIAVSIVAGIISHNETATGSIRAIANFVIAPFWVVFMVTLFKDVKRIKGEVSAVSSGKAFKVFASIGALIVILGLGFLIYTISMNGLPTAK